MLESPVLRMLLTKKYACYRRNSPRSSLEWAGWESAAPHIGQGSRGHFFNSWDPGVGRSLSRFVCGHGRGRDRSAEPRSLSRHLCGVGPKDCAAVTEKSTGLSTT